ncbi:MAG: HTH domain-containing protein [Oscillospiraceae bacterium]|jgi:predicted DNA-binding transcriptional regulator YafY|nr:HTH domain-containing protein [Oscillospiraceae bacterium]
MQSYQIQRLFGIIYILLDKKIVTTRELAERFEVSPRTIVRDIDTLSAAGIPFIQQKATAAVFRLWTAISLIRRPSQARSRNKFSSPDKACQKRN